MKRIGLFVEGDDETKEGQTIVKRLLADANPWEFITLDTNPFRVGQVNKLVKDNCHEWKRKLQDCLKRENVGAILLLLDGDINKVGGEDFCAMKLAGLLAGA